MIRNVYKYGKLLFTYLKIINNIFKLNKLTITFFLNSPVDTEMK